MRRDCHARGHWFWQDAAAQLLELQTRLVTLAVELRQPGLLRGDAGKKFFAPRAHGRAARYITRESGAP